jgi:hypothetical protein
MPFLPRFSWSGLPVKFTLPHPDRQVSHSMAEPHS